MAHTKSAKKRIRQAKKAKLRNRHYKSMVKTSIKAVETAAKPDEMASAFQKAVSVIDKLVQKGILHRNSGANKKSRLAKLVNSKQA
ncbi:MAG TPA: 30S ribosomal protein S20 [Candidatus Marinimicrobia bacterium]|nr:30S ribosomal protein S20 [Candidatus Neomarinimicrobiota bacterium]